VPRRQAGDDRRAPGWLSHHAAAENSHKAPGVRVYKSLYVTESGLYSLIIGCEKPEAKRFKKWVTSEVLPAIRKYGYYSAVEAAREKTTVQLLAAWDAPFTRTTTSRASGSL